MDEESGEFKVVLRCRGIFENWSTRTNDATRGNGPHSSLLSARLFPRAIILWQKQHDALDFCALRPPIQAAPSQLIVFKVFVTQHVIDESPENRWQQTDIPLTFPYGCQYFSSQLLYSRYRSVHHFFRWCPCVAMAVILVTPLSATWSHWPSEFRVAQLPFLCSRARAAAPYRALLAVREPGRELFSSPSAALQSAEKR